MFRVRLYFYKTMPIKINEISPIEHSETRSANLTLQSAYETAVTEEYLVNEQLGEQAIKNLSRSLATEIQYAVNVRGLFKKSSAARTTDESLPFEPSLDDVVSDLIESATDRENRPAKISVATWVIYRSSLLWHLSKIRTKSESAQAAYSRLAGIKKTTRFNTEKRRRKETFKNDDFASLINTLTTFNRNGSNWGSKTSFWLQAGIAAGARGVEWNSAAWLDRDKCDLLIQNAKRKVSLPAFSKIGTGPQSRVTSGSAGEQAESVYDLDAEPQEYSQVDEREKSRIVRVDRNDGIYIDFHLGYIEHHASEQAKNGVSREDAFQRYYQMARRTMREACLVAFDGKRSYHLRHGRSQFSSNKKVDHSIGAVAELMGHTNTRTTMSSYGSRKAGLKRLESNNAVQTQSEKSASRKKFDDFFGDGEQFVPKG